MKRQSTGSASCSDFAKAKASAVVGPSKVTSPLLMTRSGRVAFMYSLTRLKFSVSFGWLRARCGSEIWVRRNSGIENTPWAVSYTRNDPEEDVIPGWSAGPDPSSLSGQGGIAIAGTLV